MYSSCLFCQGDLGKNEAIEHFQVGRRLETAWRQAQETAATADNVDLEKPGDISPRSIS